MSQLTASTTVPETEWYYNKIKKTMTGNTCGVFFGSRTAARIGP